MKKIPTIFVRDPENPDRILLDQIHPACRWVFDGEGTPTRKYDGTCVLLDVQGRWFARRQVKVGKSAPEGYIPVDRDDVTGKVFGWEPMENSGWKSMHAEALFRQEGEFWLPGTYELCGPKINGNPERLHGHMLVAHSAAQVIPLPAEMFRPLDMALWVKSQGWEGIVWHHPDGRMAKLKVRDLF
jgi:hypothetical protein